MKITEHTNACEGAGHVFGQYARQLHGYLRKKLGNDQDSEELLSDVMMKLYKNCERLEEVDNVRAWLYRITYNAAMDYYRDRQKKQESERAAGNIEVPVEQDIYQSMSQLVPAMVNLLPEEYRSAVMWCDLEGLSQQEVADKLNISLSGAKSRIQRGRKKLKELFSECIWIESDRRGRPVSYSIKPHCNPLQHLADPINQNLLPGAEGDCGC
ncbi:sigma-70 family RNA polymerase sigma factor [Roseivirga sp. BDSF3-8]|uniref:sigma-70 family RNA polymerase sigma factor n=1 Tax=Roseivirga sp. BDSF3-8 TaxID=3241598 RepID=UPI003531C82D